MWLTRFLTTSKPALSALLPLFAVFAGLGLGPLLPLRAAQADEIELRASLWCPYVCKTGTSHPGLLIELIREALAPFGHEVRYETQSWSYSLATVQNGSADGLIGPPLYTLTDLTFTAPVAHYQEALAFRRGEARALHHPQDLQGLQLGAVRDYLYSDRLAQYIAANRSRPSRVQLLSGENTVTRNLKKLLSQRIDLALEAQAVLVHQVRQLDLSDQIDIQPGRMQRAIRVGFTPGAPNSARYVKEFNTGLQQLRQSGRYQEILARYGQAETL